MTQAFNLAQLANNLNTSGQLDATDGLNGLVANANLASSGTASSSTFLRGDRTWGSQKVVQVLNANTSTPVSWGTGAWIDTGLSLTITPTSASNSILITIMIGGCESYNNSSGVVIKFMRNSTSIHEFAIYYGYPVSMYIPGGGVTYLDSPATTSPVTYKVQHYRGLGSGNGVLQGDGSYSYMTLMEIAP